MDHAPPSLENTMADGAMMYAEGRRPRLALLYSVSIGLLGGLIGLGGAEFRLPVLACLLGYAARQAVALNLAVTLATVLAVLGSRGALLSLGSLANLIPVVLALIGGSVLGASFGPSLTGRLSDRQFERVIFALLVGLGGGLILDSVLTHEPVGLIDSAISSQV